VARKLALFVIPRNADSSTSLRGCARYAAAFRVADRCARRLPRAQVVTRRRAGASLTAAKDTVPP